MYYEQFNENQFQVSSTVVNKKERLRTEYAFDPFLQNLKC